jgi:hypothetical protein
MGFAVWVEKDLVWAEGTHEYRPMGVAVIAQTDLFSTRDFSGRRSKRSRNEARFIGLFASLSAVNAFLRKRRSQPIKKNFNTALRRVIPII